MVCGEVDRWCSSCQLASEDGRVGARSVLQEIGADVDVDVDGLDIVVRIVGLEDFAAVCRDVVSAIAQVLQVESGV